MAVASARGHELVAAAEAEAEAARLVAVAQDLVADADHLYAEFYSAATRAGWVPADLNALGFQLATTISTRRGRGAVEQPALVPANDAPPTLPKQHVAPDRDLVTAP